ncbi:MAG: hypothetical protein KKB30_08555 [Proteobacteria bacterium]|nr:hypothetical protein [Pseudomonadota bacterium]MBU1716928.1 hypothetical protein [Pseudomonadota bacterium]
MYGLLLLSAGIYNPLNAAIISTNESKILDFKEITTELRQVDVLTKTMPPEDDYPTDENISPRIIETTTSWQKSPWLMDLCRITRHTS